MTDTNNTHNQCFVLLYCVIRYDITSISEEPAASIFRVEILKMKHQAPRNIRSDLAKLQRHNPEDSNLNIIFFAAKTFNFTKFCYNRYTDGLLWTYLSEVDTKTFTLCVHLCLVLTAIHFKGSILFFSLKHENCN
jgi:hypothetical protein